MAYSDNALESQLRRLLVDSSSSATSIDHLKEKYDIPKNANLQAFFLDLCKLKEERDSKSEVEAKEYAEDRDLYGEEMILEHRRPKRRVVVEKRRAKEVGWEFDSDDERSTRSTSSDERFGSRSEDTFSVWFLRLWKSHFIAPVKDLFSEPSLPASEPPENAGVILQESQSYAPSGLQYVYPVPTKDFRPVFVPDGPSYPRGVPPPSIKSRSPSPSRDSTSGRVDGSLFNHKMEEQKEFFETRLKELQGELQGSREEISLKLDALLPKMNEDFRKELLESRRSIKGDLEDLWRELKPGR